MSVTHPCHISMLSLCCAFCPKAALSKPPGGARTFLLIELQGRRAERRKGGRGARRLGPHRSSSIKGQEKSLAPRGFPTGRTVCAGGHVPVCEGAQDW